MVPRAGSNIGEETAHWFCSLKADWWLIQSWSYFTRTALRICHPVLKMTPELRIFSLWNSNNGSVANRESPLWSERSFNKEDPMSRTNIEKYRIDQSNATRLVLCAFSYPLTLYHNWSSFITLQSKLAPPAQPHANLFNLPNL